jgi:hypothetical protein
VREFVKVLPLGLLLPIVIGAASVKPDDAISNISDWVHRLGFEGASRWLSNPAADNRAIVGSLGVAALYAFLVWTVPAIRERRANPQSEKLKTHLLSMLFYFMCAILVIAVWRFVPPPPAPVKIAPIPAAPVAPKPPPPPWVSQEEIEEAKKAGRILLPFRPEELGIMSLSNGAESMTAYTGKWVKISNPFDHLSQKNLSDKKEYIIVSVRNTWSTTLLFEPKKWQERLVFFRPGDQLNAFCQLYGFEGKRGDVSGHLFIGTNCELR